MPNVLFKHWKVLGTIAVLAVTGALVMSGCSQPVSANVSGQGTTSGTTVNVYLSIVTGGMIGKSGWPAYVPTDLTVPANSTVDVHIVDFDDGTAPLQDGSPYAKVTGVTGNTVTTQALTKGDPNDPGPSSTYSELGVNDVAHTFTVAGLGINVPIPVTSVVSFSFKSGAAGTYSWQCMSPCGTGPDGTQGAMQTKGYMEGTLVVQ